MTEQILFPPLHNGLDYLKNVIEHLRDKPDSRDLKYAVLHLQAAVEVLLKARLIREHWSLVFEKPSAASSAARASGDFKSVTLEDTLARLTNIAGVEVPKPAQDQFKRLANKRNKLQHFGMAEQAIAIESLVGQVLDGLLCFIRDHLRPGASPEDEHLLDETQELIRVEMKRIESLVNARLTRIEPELAARAGVIVGCPDCEYMALLTDPGDLRCHFCDRTFESDDAASKYAATVLRFSWYESASGSSDNPVHTCMDCGSETLVQGATVLSNPNAPVWVCFNGCLVADDQEISGCFDCGVPMRMDQETGVCADCSDGAFNRY